MSGIRDTRTFDPTNQLYMKITTFASYYTLRRAIQKSPGKNQAVLILNFGGFQGSTIIANPEVCQSLYVICSK
jgi:hypothetical protein